MDDKTGLNHEGSPMIPGPNQGTETGRRVNPPERPWPNRAERLALIRDYQSQALTHEDPHLANVQLFDGDTMLLALRLRDILEKDLIEGTTTPEGSRRFAERAETFLKCIRQLDRNARIKRQLVELAKKNRGLD